MDLYCDTLKTKQVAVIFNFKDGGSHNYNYNNTFSIHNPMFVIKIKAQIHLKKRNKKKKNY